MMRLSSATEWRVCPCLKGDTVWVVDASTSGCTIQNRPYSTFFTYKKIMEPFWKNIHWEPFFIFRLAFSFVLKHIYFSTLRMRGGFLPSYRKLSKAIFILIGRSPKFWKSGHIRQWQFKNYVILIVYAYILFTKNYAKPDHTTTPIVN